MPHNAEAAAILCAKKCKIMVIYLTFLHSMLYYIPNYFVACVFCSASNNTPLRTKSPTRNTAHEKVLQT